SCTTPRPGLPTRTARFNSNEEQCSPQRESMDHVASDRFRGHQIHKLFGIKRFPGIKLLRPLATMLKEQQLQRHQQQQRQQRQRHMRGVQRRGKIRTRKLPRATCDQ
ncbi:unnamed protein product, partial [Pylaiella littoralis]